jgi:membrane fusion protein (multidrug efflux system)
MNKSGVRRGLIVLVVAGIAGWAARHAYHSAHSTETTDDAFLRGNIAAISAKVGGEIIAIHVPDNASVKRGDLLLELDPRDYSERAASANAAMTQAEAALEVNAHALALGQGDRQQLVSERKGLQGKLNAAIAMAHLAQSELDATRVYAPAAGKIGSRAVAVGERVSAGRRLMSIVPADNLWVEANFKETQLHEVAAGQPVKIRLDAIPGEVFSGHVESLAPASGSEFALLPPENASGNFTRIVQRVGVRVALDSAGNLPALLRPGLSARVSIDTSPNAALKTASADPQMNTQVATP